MTRTERPFAKGDSENMALTIDDVIHQGRELRRTRRGEAHPNHRLTEADVRVLRAAAAREDYPGHASTARLYGVCARTIHQAVTRATWKHVQP